MDLASLLAHGGHPVYDHPAMAVIMGLALVIPWVVLVFVGRWFIRSRDDDERQSPPRP